MGFFSDITGALGDVFGEDSNSSQSSQTILDSLVKTKSRSFDKGKSTSQLKVDKKGINNIIRKALSGETGLAEVFSQEQGAGLFNSTVATSQTGDLMSRIAGEIAELTGKKVKKRDFKKGTNKSVDTRSQTDVNSRSGNSKGGLIRGAVGDLFGGSGDNDVTGSFTGSGKGNKGDDEEEELFVSSPISTGNGSGGGNQGAGNAGQGKNAGPGPDGSV